MGGPHPHPGEPEEGCEEVGAVELGEGDDAWVISKYGASSL